MMTKPEQNKFETSSITFDSYIEKMVGIINLKEGIFEMATDLPLKETFFGKIHLAYNLPQIKVLLITSADSTLGEDNYDRFEKSIKESAEGELNLTREENALSQYIRLMYSSEKIVISGVRGSVVGSFLGAILSTDYRIASENTVFSFPHIRYESSPQGSLAYFLPKYLGPAKAKKILFLGDPLTAGKAYELGLVDDVIGNDSFEDKCIEIAARMSQIPPAVVAKTKRLLLSELKELNDYLKLEAQLSVSQKIMTPHSMPMN